MQNQTATGNIKSNNFGKILTRDDLEIDLIKQLTNFHIVADTRANSIAEETDESKSVDDNLGEILVGDSNDDGDSNSDNNSVNSIIGNNYSENSNISNQSSDMIYKLGLMSDNDCDEGHCQYKLYDLDSILNDNYDKDIDIGYQELLSHNLTNYAIEVMSSIDEIFYLMLITNVPTYGFNNLVQLKLRSCEYIRTIEYLPPNLEFLDLFGCVYSGPEHNCEVLCISGVPYFDLTKFPKVVRLFMESVKSYYITADNIINFISVNYAPVIDLSYFPNIHEVNIAKFESRKSKHITLVKNLPERKITFEFKYSKYPSHIIVNNLSWNTEFRECEEWLGPDRSDESDEPDQ